MYTVYCCSGETRRHRVALLFVDDYHNGRASVCVSVRVSLSAFAELPSYMSYYDEDGGDDDNDVLPDDDDPPYQPLFRLDRFTHSFTHRTLEVCSGNGNSRFTFSNGNPVGMAMDMV